MQYDFLHAIISGALLFATYWAMELSGVLEGKTKGRKRLLLAIAFAFVILIFNLVWPGQGA
ncbi:hypothetical protein [uncultured Shimia sp.]|uniref:hypothetical protein n=1 Tax=uncultured Shimia sp. TaxID=573152 RepID=UPI0026170B56|nr:hypothetical protein [uncultured Shimia sp.]